MIIFSCYIHVRNDVEVAGLHLYVLIMVLISKTMKTLIYVMLSVHENARVYFTSKYIFLDSSWKSKNNPEGRSLGPTFEPPASGYLPLASGRKGPQASGLLVSSYFATWSILPKFKLCVGFLEKYHRMLTYKISVFRYFIVLLMYWDLGSWWNTIKYNLRYFSYCFNYFGHCLGPEI